MKHLLKKPDSRGMLALIAAFAINALAYWGGRALSFFRPHGSFACFLDDRIPLVPWTIVVYFGSFLFWAVNFWIAAGLPDEQRDRFFCAQAMAEIVCMICFIALPTTLDRPEITGNSLWEKFIRLLYGMDSADNLFPSIHCLLSWLSWIAVRKRREIPLGYRCFSLIMAVAVCISTLTTRQHVVADVPAGILLAEAAYALAKKNVIRRGYTRWMTQLEETPFWNHIWQKAR